MDDQIISSEDFAKAIELVQKQLDIHLKGEKKHRRKRFIIAALGGIPWVGGFLSASAALAAEKDQSKVSELQKQWLEEHKERILKLCDTITKILERVEGFGDEVQERLESPEYLTLVRKGFRTWDQADTDEKRELIRKLLSSACASKLCPDDLVRLFLDWIDTYHEAHFRVIREIYLNSGITRGAIWDHIAKSRPRENSAEADVYKLLIRDLSTGGVIRQHRETDVYGNYIKRNGSGRSKYGSSTMKSAFDDSEPYELTQLGKQFVHYTMQEIVPRIEGNEENSQS